MNRGRLAIHDFMTKMPHSIGLEQTLKTAHEVMLRHHIRHLPVLHGGKLVGLISERDIGLVEALKDVDPASVTVEEAMSPIVYTVEPKTPLAEVVRHMAMHKQGSALVVEGTKVVGIFTAIDALIAFAGFLDER